MRIIIHSDLNNFYASVECIKNPSLKDKPVIVTGIKKDRHGIVLAKNLKAKKAGIKTGETYWEAKSKCADLIEVEADFVTYLNVSKAVRKIYENYTDQVEAYGIDECWLDVTNSTNLFGNAINIANKIKNQIYDELGLSVSIGISWNKIFAKIGSDLKNEYVSIITPNNYKKIVWEMPVENLIYVGKATKKKLNKLKIYTIGELAKTDLNVLKNYLGKWGEYLYIFANGKDNSEVKVRNEIENVKSIGNSLTVYRDLISDDDVKMIIYLLVDSITSRIREIEINYIKTVHISIRTEKLSYFKKQFTMKTPTGNMYKIAEVAFNNFKKMFDWKENIREIGISVSNFYFGPIQYNFFENSEKNEKQIKIDKAIDLIRNKYKNNIIKLAIIQKDQRLSNIDIKGSHIIHPYNYFKINKN